MKRSLFIAAAAAIAILAAAPAGAAGRLPRASTIVTVLETTNVATEPRVADYGQLVAAHTVRPRAGVRLLSALRTGLGASYVPEGATLVPARHEDGSELLCYSVKGDFMFPWMRPCFRDNDADGQFDDFFYISPPDRGPSMLYFSGDAAPSGPAPGRPRYERLPEPAARTEVLGLKYVGPISGFMRDGRFVLGEVEFQIVMGPDSAHTGKVATITVFLDAQGRGRAKGPLDYEVAVDQVFEDGRAIVQVLSTPAKGEIVF